MFIKPEVKIGGRNVLYSASFLIGRSDEVSIKPSPDGPYTLTLKFLTTEDGADGILSEPLGTGQVVTATNMDGPLLSASVGGLPIGHIADKRLMLALGSTLTSKDSSGSRLVALTIYEEAAE